MGLSPTLSIIQPVTIDTMLNNGRPNIGDDLNFVTCEQTYIPTRNRTTHEDLYMEIHTRK